jgi:hypothetical protein
MENFFEDNFHAVKTSSSCSLFVRKTFGQKNVEKMERFILKYFLLLTYVVRERDWNPQSFFADLRAVNK